MGLRNVAHVSARDPELTRYVTSTPEEFICPIWHTGPIENFDSLSLGVSDNGAGDGDHQCRER